MSAGSTFQGNCSASGKTRRRTAASSSINRLTRLRGTFMPLALSEDAFGDTKNAAFLAGLSAYAYLPQDSGGPAIASELGLTAKLISVNNTQAYVAYNDDHLVVAFRGSEKPTSIDGLKDWLLTNAANMLIQPEGPLANEFV